MRAESEAHLGPVARARDTAPLIAHVIFRLDTGGLENGLVNLINRIPAERFRHAIVCLTGHSDFRRRIHRPDVQVFSLNKPPGNSLRMHGQLWGLFRELRPQIVHTRNLGALEATLPAALAGVPVRIHGEHGRDVNDLDGSNLRLQRVRRLFKPFVNHYIALSRDLEGYLQHKICVPASRIAQIYNGVDCGLFHPREGVREAVFPPGFATASDFIVGTVGRMQAVKDQLTLARAFVALARELPDAARRLRLVLIGDGPLRQEAGDILGSAGLERSAWLPGERDDIPAILRNLDLFVLPSLAEGISNTILEAMASGLPVLATAVGGNPELVEPGVTGALVPPSDPAGMAREIRRYVESAELCARQGMAARCAVERAFGMEAMVGAYLSLYDGYVRNRRPIR